MQCNICNNKNTRLLYSNSQNSLSTKFLESKDSLNIYLCKNCFHIFSDFPLDAYRYYDEEYNIDLNSEEEDQLYKVEKGKNIYRSDHQYKIFKDYFLISADTIILDYGCAKSSTMRKLSKDISIYPYLFDVSSCYKDFWLTFTKKENCAIHTIPDNWYDKFDIVTSFFSLEHVHQANDFVKQVHNVLKLNASFFLIVPDTLVNIADFIVNDHVNHFTKESITFLLEKNGFKVDFINTKDYYGALIVKATKVNQNLVSKTIHETTYNDKSIMKVATYWNNYNETLKKTIATIGNESFAIYGSGFYGSLIYQSTSSIHENFVFFIDKNPFRQKETLFEYKIVAPEDVKEKVKHIIVGLNPSISRDAISQVQNSFDGIYIHFIDEI